MEWTNVITIFGVITFLGRLNVGQNFGISWGGGSKFLAFILQWSITGLFSLVHVLFKNKTILQQFNVKNGQCRHWDSNSQPLRHESPPITTRPRLSPNGFKRFLLFDEMSEAVTSSEYVNSTKFFLSFFLTK